MQNSVILYIYICIHTVYILQAAGESIHYLERGSRTKHKCLMVFTCCRIPTLQLLLHTGISLPQILCQVCLPYAKAVICFGDTLLLQESFTVRTWSALCLLICSLREILMSLHPQISVFSSFTWWNTFIFVILPDLCKIKHPHLNISMLFLFLRRNEPKKIEYQVLVQAVGMTWTYMPWLASDFGR